jgi:beta-lactamase superfamily II metal-dependent hydrolase
MFEIEMLPAREGDCLWIRYGDSKKPKQILIDAGRKATGKELRERFSQLPASQRTFELLIVSHIDRDHIEGVLELLKDDLLKFKDVWFNAYFHLTKVESFGAVQGELLSKTIGARKLPWNAKFKGKAVCLPSRGLKKITLDGGIKLTLLSPDRDKLVKLIPVWQKECEEAGLIPGKRPPARKRIPGVESFGTINIEGLSLGPFKSDGAEPNGSSIAVLLEFQKKRVLLAADAHPDRIITSIKALKKTQKRLKLDAFKVSHHGSEGNVSKELLELVDCRRYLISTNGSYFKHPKAAAMARIIKFGGKNSTLYFNYRNDLTKIWNSKTFKDKYKYEVVFPKTGKNGSLLVSL